MPLPKENLCTKHTIGAAVAEGTIIARQVYIQKKKSAHLLVYAAYEHIPCVQCAITGVGCSLAGLDRYKHNDRLYIDIESKRLQYFGT